MMLISIAPKEKLMYLPLHDKQFGTWAARGMYLLQAAAFEQKISEREDIFVSEPTPILVDQCK